MNPQLSRRFASAAFIIGFFVLWELLCIGLQVSDIVLPRPSQIIVTLWQRMPALWPHTLQTLYTTLVGFALGIADRHRARRRWSARPGSPMTSPIRCWSASASHPESRGRADLRAVVRRRHRAGDPHRDDHVHLSRSS